MKEEEKSYIEYGMVNLAKLVSLGDFDLFEKESSLPATQIEKETLEGKGLIEAKQYKALYSLAQKMGYSALENALLNGESDPEKLLRALSEDVAKNKSAFAGPNESRLFTINDFFAKEMDPAKRLGKMKKAVLFDEGLKQKDVRFLKRALENDPNNPAIQETMMALLNQEPVDADKFEALLAVEKPADPLALAIYNECFDPKNKKLSAEFQERLKGLREEGYVYDEKEAETLIRNGLQDLAVIRLYNFAETILKERCPAQTDEEFNFFDALNKPDKNGCAIPHADELHQLRQARNSICHANKKYAFTVEDIRRWQSVIALLKKGE